jgi:AraC-like DNA-binding protein
MGNSIQFVTPSDILQKYIDEYYFIELDIHSNNEGFEQKPISNGCIELYIGYGKTFGAFYKNKETSLIYSSAIVGAHDLNNEIKVFSLPRMFNVVSIVFKPEGFYRIFKIPSSEVYNGFFATDQVIGEDIKLLQEQLEETQSFVEKKRAIDLFLTKQLIKNENKNCKIQTGFNIAAYIQNNEGNMRMKQIMSEFRVTERTLQRNVKAAFGLSPKELCKIARLNSLLDYISNQKAVNWSDMVSKFGYYDQNHLISEFRGATDITPDVFMKNKEKTIFKIDNHIVKIEDSAVSSEIQKILTSVQG